MAKPRNLLAGRKYDLGAAKKGVGAPKKSVGGSFGHIEHPWMHVGIIGGGIALGYVTYPYWQQPLGMTLMGAAGSITAVGILLLVFDLFHDTDLKAQAMA
jgi:hypothetical protein